MTLHLKRINGFGNGNGGGGGGGGEVTDEVIVDAMAYNNKGDFDVTYSGFQGKFNGLFIDKPFFKQQLTYGSVSPGGGSDRLYTATVVYDGSSFVYTNKSSILLSFGQVYYTQTSIGNISAVSPNKEFVVVCGVNNNTNIFVVKLTKDNNDDYIFDTSFSTISLDTGVSGYTKPCFINNNTFCCLNGTSLDIYEITNGAISFVKTISLDITPTYIYSCNDLIIVGDTSKIEFIDYSTESVVYTETSVYYGGICIWGNKVIFRNLGNVPFFIYEIENGVVTKENFTINENTFYKSATSPNMVILKTIQNKIFVFCSCYSTEQCFQFAEIDFGNNIITQLPVSGEEFRLPSTGTYYYINCYYQDETTMYCYAAYQGGFVGSRETRYLFSYTPTTYQLTYKDKKYQFLYFIADE